MTHAFNSINVKMMKVIYRTFGEVITTQPYFF